MLVFATDLDRTIIFSQRFLTGCEDVTLVERKQSELIAYMTGAAKELFKKLARSITVVPVTTRNREEYNRISVLQEIDYKYCILNNGGRIYVNGAEDPTWNEIIARKTAALGKTYDQILHEFFKVFGSAGLRRYKLSGDLLWVLSVKDYFPADRLEYFRQYAQGYGWNVAATGKKIYLLPLFINKRKAVVYLQTTYLKDVRLVSAGDSILDRDMVTGADIGFIPRHGDIAGLERSNVYTTVNQGLLAGEEILKNVMAMAGKKEGC
ncbi:MAG: hypothetical protein FH756_16845 [Firmicutes bacterium]|nr:hypothetical protein [Bacillota bacterium]